ncbi:hypothetical protein B0J17DRAFT_682143 [Rhizoctonia solani]|nr:hypothetical protein B0J17DRAFT_682143 [Rhizoctonia solani]
MSSEHRQACLFSLADAADALTKAAATLAAAARATAEAFSTEASRPASPEESYGINLGRGSDVVASETALSDEGESNLRQDIDTGDGEGERSLPAAEDDEDRVDHRPIDTYTAEQVPGISNTINPPYRLLVDTEADVFLFVCALIDKRQKVVCYIPCGTPPLKTYMQLMEKVTESSIYILNSSTSLKRDQNYLDFLESSGSVLLVPETLLPQFKIEGDNSWVIHVGWPANETQYNAQRRNHKAQNNILVAYSGDQALYPAGNSIVDLTEPWPKDGASFRASISILRSLYEVILSEISLDLKSKVYMDYIQFHGVHGPRLVESWTPSMVVQRANEYLTKVLLWSGEHTGGDDIPLPEVSHGFVTQNNLQSAVLDGLLRVADNSYDPRSQASPAPRSDSVVTHIEFQPTTGQTYFAIDEEFDAIPLICFISQQYDKVICFLEGQGALRSYQQLFTKITGHLAISPTVLNDNQSTEEAVVQFLSAPSPAILLLAYNTNNLPPALKEGSVDCCLYWGFSVPLSHAKKNRALINCETTIMIMTAVQRRGINFTADTKKHPSTGMLQDLTENSILAPMRDTTKSVLMSNRRIVKALYSSRVFGLGVIPRSSLSAEDVARRANQYAARVLLHGELEDGSERFPPVEERPPVPRKTVEKFGLELAVEAGLLTIGN